MQGHHCFFFIIIIIIIFYIHSKKKTPAYPGGVIFYRNPARYYSIIFRAQFIESIVWYSIIIDCIL